MCPTAPDRTPDARDVSCCGVCGWHMAAPDFKGSHSASPRTVLPWLLKRSQGTASEVTAKRKVRKKEEKEEAEEALLSSPERGCHAPFSSCPRQASSMTNKLALIADFPPFSLPSHPLFSPVKLRENWKSLYFQRLRKNGEAQ